MAGKKTKTKKTEAQRPEDESSIKLASQLAIGNVSELVAELESALAASDSIRVDIGEVQQVDTAVLQVLVGFSNSALGKNLKVDWIGRSEILTSSASTLGLNQYLEFNTDDTSEEISEEINEDDLCPVF